MTLENSPVVIKGGSEEFRTIGMKREREFEPEPLSQPLDHAHIIKPAISIPPPPKRARSSSYATIIAPELTPTAIMEQEVKACAYHLPERRRTFQLALESIVANDIEAFIRIENEFLQAFKLRFVYEFEKAGYKDYLSKFMVLFGADKFFNRFGSYSRQKGTKYEEMITMDVLKYLIDTKPLDTVLNTLLGFKQIIYTAEMITELTTLIQAKYPRMDYFRSLALKLVKNDTQLNLWWSTEIFAAESELDTFKAFSSKLDFNSHRHHDFLLQVPLDKADLYVQCTDKEKFVYIHMIIAKDDLERFEQIIALDPNMVYYINEDRKYCYGRENQQNLLDICVDNIAVKCFSCLMDIVPEMFQDPSKLAPVLIKIINKQNLQLLEAFFGNVGNGAFGVDFKIQDSRGTTHTEYSVIQYAFSSHCPKTLTYFVSKFGIDRVKAEIFAMWPTKESIAFYALSGVFCGNDMINFMIDALGIKATDQFTYEGKTGDISIFLTTRTEHLRSKLFRS